MKKTIILITVILSGLAVFGQGKQKDTSYTLTPEQTRDLLDQIKFDSTKFIDGAADNACQCIDSFKNISNKNAKDYTAEITECIDKQVSSLQLALKVMNSMRSGEKAIILNPDKESDEYIRNYRSIERMLRDSCDALTKLMATHDKETKNSFSDNADAIAEYNKGVVLIRDEKYEEALPYFEKAVKLDKNFAFAWDNIGICNRRLGNYEKAVKAYKRSIEIDPEGVTPLQNLPVAYEFLKKYDEAIEAYGNLAKLNAKDPEIFFGTGRIYLMYKKDMEKALTNLCKAYNLYTEAKSPYRSDAEKLISMVYAQMKKDNQLELFNKILKEHNISTE